MFNRVDKKTEQSFAYEQGHNRTADHCRANEKDFHSFLRLLPCPLPSSIEMKVSGSTFLPV